MNVIKKMEDTKKDYLAEIGKMEAQIENLENEIQKYLACVEMLNKIIESAKELEEESDDRYK